MESKKNEYKMKNSSCIGTNNWHIWNGFSGGHVHITMDIYGRKYINKNTFILNESCMKKLERDNLVSSKM